MGVNDILLENLAKFFAVFFGSANERALKKYWPIVARVNDAWLGLSGRYGPAVHGLSDAALREKTDEFRRRIVKGESEDDLLPEAFATCREASHRTLGEGRMVPARHQQLAVRGDQYRYEDVDGDIPLFAHFDVQILGGAVLHDGKIAEMVTGEGKTLVATLPSYLNALRPNDRWIELARELQGDDVDRWTFQPYGLFVETTYEDIPPPEDAPEGTPPERRLVDTRRVWRTMPKLRPDPENADEIATWQAPIEIVGISRGVHVVTVNDYLAQRDADYNKPLYDALGIVVGAIQSGMDAKERYPIYRGDIIYGTNSEFGFDYLRDNLKVRRQDQVQADRFFAIVDEVDSVLIDEARTPLIISGSTHQTADKYHLADRVARRLHGGEGNVVEEKIAEWMREGLQREDARIKAEEDFDFVYSERDHSAKLTERGMNRVLRELGMDNLYDQENLDLPHYIDNALRAHSLYHLDRHYIVKDGQVFIVDEFTGRVLEGRRWSDGLHQAVEAKENLRIKEESQTVATITYQNFFRLYDRLAGMTGTAMTEAKEFDRIYKLGVIAIPTNRPLRRVNYPDLVYGTLKEKYQALIDHVEEVHATGRPILIGTVSIERSELISGLLESRGIPHDVLNAKNHAREAGIVQNAGQFGAVVVATNMAGRGTDIKLGDFTREQQLDHWKRHDLAPKDLVVPENADDDTLADALLPLWVDHYLSDIVDKEAYASRTSEAWRAQLEERWKEYGLSGPRLATRVADLGGLHIVGTERHDARRIDNQLRGRSGRQGDPGSSRFFLSLEDDTMRMFGGEKVKGLMQWMGLKDGVPIESKMVSRTIENTQRKVEERNFEVRKNLIEYDQVMNDQRTVVYGRRQDWVEDRNTRDAMVEYCGSVIDGRVSQALSGSAEDWDVHALATWMKDTFNTPVDPAPLDAARTTADPEKALAECLYDAFEKAYDEKENALGADMMRLLEKMILIEKLDAKWMDHLAAMDLLKEGIHLRSIAGQDPKIRYKIEGFKMFNEMWGHVEKDVAELVMKVTLAAPREVRQSVEVKETRHDEFDRRANAADAVGREAGEAAKPRPIVNRTRRIGPNEPCPCGSGKKYKKCHGKG